MASSMVICEKPSQARDIAAAVGSKFGPVLPCQGHLLELEEPEDAHPNWKTWAAVLLWLGEPYRYVPKSGGGVPEKLRAIGAQLKQALSRRIVLLSFWRLRVHREVLFGV